MPEGEARLTPAPLPLKAGEGITLSVCARHHLRALIPLDGGASHHINTTVTTVVLLIAAVKAFLVMWHFMEVRRAPVWLKATTSGWVLALFALLLTFYFTSL